ncbi:uncharacterized protein LOC120475475 [Pimephales promelas]|uniref:uncharacterized protein LOC120475475 n=1 Tax=Pimephales promelas TaxID=90988 RepID=UPI001955E676|nr:uncharacterized protein LOC120475475 [Pimephales promelas]
MKSFSTEDELKEYQKIHIREECRNTFNRDVNLITRHLIRKWHVCLRKSHDVILEGECFNQPSTWRQCGCAPPYALYEKPKPDVESQKWLVALKLKNPPKRLFVCSYHFIDKKPTEENPFPELWLGYERPPQQKRRKRDRNTSDTQSDEVCIELKFKDAATQWEDLTKTDHIYAAKLEFRLWLMICSWMMIPRCCTQDCVYYIFVLLY